MPTETEGGKIPVLRIPDVGTAPMDRRFRVPGGTVIHRAAILEGEEGFTVVLSCDTDFFRWFRDSEDERLDLIKSDEADVTCQQCQREMDRLVEAHDG